VSQLELLEPTWVLHRAVLARGRAEAHPADLVARLRDVRLRLDAVAALPPESLAAHGGVLVAWAREVGAVRKRMREDGPAAAVPDGTGEEVLDRATVAIAELDAAFTRAAWHRLGGS
jgi:hypothetical protein